MKQLNILACLCTFLLSIASHAQSVLDPNDPVINYHKDSPLVQPPFGQIGKWVRNKKLNWNTSNYKAYIYKGNAFRLRFPKTYNPTANDGKKYPMNIFFHGLGDKGPITDNESHLYHGGEEQEIAIEDGIFDGYALFMQSQGSWGTGQYKILTEIIDYMVANNKLDPFQINVHGLSAGAQGTWEMAINYPKYVASVMPMSGVSIGYKDANIVNLLKYTPIWLFQGGRDGSPAPSTSQQVRDAFLDAGGNFTYSEYADLGHGTWDRAYAEPDFFPFILRGYKSNPWPLYGKTEVCPGDAIDFTLGLTAGYNAYEWRKNGVIISGATSNTLHVTETGVYDARVKMGNLWSDWSHIPVEVKIKGATITPPISVSGLMSTAIPAADGKNYVNLEIPDNGYVAYTWKRVGDNTVLGTERILRVTQPGDYIVSAEEKLNCSSVFSAPFKVINANGINAPSAAANLIANPLSNTSIELNWTDNPNPIYNETAFEIYRATNSGGPYTYAGQVPADTLTFHDNALASGIKYFYSIRAINDNGAAPLSNEASATTYSDTISPDAPVNLQIISTGESYAQLSWDSATDNLGIERYEIYVNDVKTYSTTQTSFIVSGLNSSEQYSMYVKAIDVSGNSSVKSNQVSTPAGTNPAAPTNIRATAKAYNKINLQWEDNSSNESGFEIFRATNIGGPYNIIFTTAANVTSFADTNLTASTTYYYRVHAINQYGVSAFDINSTSGLKYSYYEGQWTNLPDFDTLTPVKKGYLGNLSIDTALSPRYFGFKYEGVINIPGTGEYTFIINSDDGSRLYIGGLDNNHLVVDNDYLTPPTKATGSVTLSAGRYPFYVTYFQNISNKRLTVRYEGPGVPNQVIPDSAFRNYQSSATTFSLPAAPSAPSGLAADAVSSSKINLTWNDVANNETGYKVFRSIGNAANFKLLTILTANSNSFSDTALFANLVHYYKVAAVGIGETLSYSPVVSAKTKDNAPVITDIPNRTARYGITTVIQINATDADGESLTFTIQNKPAFATFTDNGDRTATLTLNPTSGQQGTYNDMKITVNDENGGSDFTSFNLTVNSNYNPVINSITDYTINENDNLTINLSATDQNGSDVLTWSVTGLPNIFSLTPGANGFATLSVKPTYTAAGTYPVQVNVSDGNGGYAIRQFLLTVNDKDPNTTIYVRFKDQTSIGAPWNSVTSVTSNNFKDAVGNTTTVGLALQTSWWAAWHEGPQTGNNSGVYPDAVLKDYYYFGIFGGPETVSAKVTGLDPSRSYNLTFYAGSIWSGAQNNGTTTFTSGTQTVSLSVQNNTQNTASINNITPAADGTITFTMAKGANTQAGYINALVITSFYDDGTAPLPPAALVAQNVPGSGVKLLWRDDAYNETAYKILRSLNFNGPFDTITQTPANTTEYVDKNVNGNTQYFYKMKAINAYGSSPFTNVVSVTTSNRIPQIAAIDDVILKNNQQLSVNVSATDDASDHITLTATNLPPFVTFTDNGNGTAIIDIIPTAGTSGSYQNIVITATDESDSSSSESFDITVTESNVTSVYLNFSDGSLAPKPWNNLTGWPFAGTTFSNMLDDSNTPTGISATLVNGFQGVVASGMRPGSGKGVYPEVVMRTGEYEGSATARTIRISGLSSANKYNFVFFNSHDDGLNGLTNFTINGQTVSLNATYNIDKTVQINGISPDANGQVTITVTKGAGADYAYLSALVIQGYSSSLNLMSPADLRVTETKRNSVSLQWADRSSNETAFEIWRATEANSTYTLLNTVGANITSYTDKNLSANRTYYYVVRAKQGAVFSNYSNLVAVTTYAYEINVNFSNRYKAASPPWNNTSALPELGDTWNNLVDATGTLTSIGLVETGRFAGLYDAGINTGDNSGIFPDKVMIESYGLFPGQSATFKITGLNLTMRYDFTFFASSQAYGDVNGAYIINNKRALLNASLNKSGTVTIYDITPDRNGEVILTVEPGTASSQLGLIGALIIKGYNAPAGSAPQPPSFSRVMSTGRSAGQRTTHPSDDLKDIKLSAFPNPFTEYFQLSLPASDNNEKVQVLIYDIAEKLVYQNQFGNLAYGNNIIRIELNNNLSAAGVYLVKVFYVNKKVYKLIKVVKAQ